MLVLRRGVYNRQLACSELLTLNLWSLHCVDMYILVLI